VRALLRHSLGGVTVTVYLNLQQPLLPLGLMVHSRLWFGFAGCEGAAEPPLERRDPFRRPQRSSDRRRPLDPSRPCGIGRCGEKGRKIGNQRAQRGHRCQLVILAREMRAGARPWPVPGVAHQPRDHWIERDVACRRQQMARPSPPRQSGPGTDGRSSRTLALMAAV